MKTITPKWYGTIIADKGKNRVMLTAGAAYQKYLDLHYKVGDKVTMSLKKHYRSRTTSKKDDGSNQNGYYWSVVVPMIADETGLTTYEVHSEIKRLFFSTPHPKYPMILIPGTTTESNTLEWEQKMEEIRAWAAINLHTRIPMPNEVDAEI